MTTTTATATATASGTATRAPRTVGQQREDERHCVVEAAASREGGHRVGDAMIVEGKQIERTRAHVEPRGTVAAAGRKVAARGLGGEVARKRVAAGRASGRIREMGESEGGTKTAVQGLTRE